MIKPASLLRQALPACIVITLLCACAPRGEDSAPPKRAVAEDTAASFIGRTWVVIASTAVASGTLYRFEPDGRLVITSPGSLTATGEWRLKGTEMEWVEESQTYRVELLSQTADALQVRVHSPGEPLDISMKPLESAAP